MRKLYGYFRSSAAFRVRIALNLKNLAYENAFVDLRHREHRTAEFAAINPHQAIPTLVEDGRVLTQSMAIIEYLDETHPDPPLLSTSPIARQRIRALSQAIACDIHPLNNMRVLLYLKEVIGAPKPAIDAWSQRWVIEGFKPLEEILASSGETGTFCHGDAPTLADVCLIPQIFNARRYDLDLTAYPTLMRIFDAGMRLPAFDLAQPSKQPDATRP